MPRKMRFTSPVLLVHTRHYISGEKFIAIIFLFPFLPPFWWHNSVKRKGHTLMPRWFITLIPEGTIDLNNLWLKCISSSAFSLDLKNYYTKPHFKEVRPLHDDLLFMNLLCASLCVHVQSEVTWSEWDNNHLLLIWRLPLFDYHESGWFQVNEILITCHCRQHFLYIYDNFFLSFYWNQCWLNRVILISNLTVCSQEWNASEHYWYTEHAEIGKKRRG